MLPLRPLFAALALACSAPLAAESFVFRGQLDDGAAPAEGRHALRLTLYASEHAPTPIAGPLELLDVPLTDGRFAVEVDFGALLPASQGWLEVAAKAADDTHYTPLGGRAPVELKAGGTCPAAWQLGGNALTNPAVDFLGTTDAQPLELRVNGERMARFTQVPFPGADTTTSNVAIGGPGTVVAPGVAGATLLGGAAPPDFVSPSPLPPGFSSLSNQVSDDFGLVLGGVASLAGNQGGTLQDAAFATLIGSRFSRASGYGSIVLGGQLNLASGSGSLVVGTSSTATGSGAVAIGQANLASGENAVALGGLVNTAAGDWGVVVGGESNVVLGANARAGGYDTCAGGTHSWAGGKSAKVRPPSGTGADPAGGACDGVPNANSPAGDSGTFVWADSQNSDFVSTGADQFAIRARGGLRLSDDTAQYFGAATRQMLNLYNTGYGIGVQGSTLYQRSNTQFAWFRDGTHEDGALDPGAGGQLLMTLGTNAGTPVGVARAQQFVNVSDRHAKTAFAPVDPLDVLARVLQLPLSEWSYKNARGERHLGPMAQDFHAAFGLGGDDRTIATLDADGVALAAIQGLHARLEAELAAQDAQLAELRRELARLRAELRDRSR
jgi:hypothetical protein